MTEPDVSTALLDGTRVLDLAGEPAALTGRILADLGAEVVKVEAPGGDPLRHAPPFAGGEHERSLRFEAWNAGKASVVASPGDAELDMLLAGADVVIDTPGWPGAPELDWETRAPHAVWVRVTPFGWTGPRSHWHASDLGVMAASANMYCTGDPDGPPTRCTEPTAYAHTGPEAAFAALTGFASGTPARIDVSMQEVVFVANMSWIAAFARTGDRGKRKGSSIGRTREIWRTSDGWVSFGLRGGKARVPSLETITRLVLEDGIEAPALTGRDWSGFRPNETPHEELRAIEEPIAEYFGRHRTAELYDLACETNLMLAPVNSPRELYASAQLAARGFFTTVEDLDGFPRSFVTVRSRDGEAAAAGPAGPAPRLGAGPRPDWAPRPAPGSAVEHGRPAWEGTKILEFGSGAAGPIVSRYFAEHGATVLRIESRTRPDFLRVYALGPDNPHGLEGSLLYDALNVGKRNATFNLKDPRAVELVRRLALEWADAISENFAPRAMKGFGLDYDTLSAGRADLVMVSSCLNGNTGPHKDYPGFGSQGSALSGYTHLTGSSDRPPTYPAGTITDSLAPRFVATALAAGLRYRERTGHGVYLDVAQVETALFTLSPWLLDYSVNGVTGERTGNRSARAVPHGAFPCRGEDRWVATAVWTDDEWERLAKLVGIEDEALATFEGRLARIDDVEAALATWTSERDREEVARELQAAGIEAVPVADFGDVHEDPQVAHREHFVKLEHPFLGESCYEHNGFRIREAPSEYGRPSPTLGQDNDWVQRELLALSEDERRRLADDGVFD